MIFPIGDFPNPRGFFAIVTYLLIAANVLVYALVTAPLSARPAPFGPELVEYVAVMSKALDIPPRTLAPRVSAYDLLLFRDGFRPAAPSLAGLLASMFLHGGLLHLAGNMLFLWIYGDNVEHRLGRLRFLAAYLATGAVATAFHTLSSPGSPVPMVGASGAISGILGFYFVFFPRNQVRLAWLLPPFYFDVFAVPARLVLGLYLVVDNLLPYLAARSDVGIAHGAHIGGFVAGVAAAWAANRRTLSSTPPEYAHAGRRARRPVGDVHEAIADGRFADAARTYFDLPSSATRGLLGPGDSLELARWLEANGHAVAALVVLRRHLRDFPDGPGRAEALTAAGRIQLYDQGDATGAYQSFVAALDLAPRADVAAEAYRGLADIEAMQKRATARRR